MFYKMIERSCNRWYASSDCTIRSIIDYMVQTGQMRDAQIEAIKTYLYLKIACNCKPLSVLFTEGAFNNLDLEELEVSAKVRDMLVLNKAAAALYEYATLKNKDGQQVSEKLETQIKKDPDSIDYSRFFNDAFYGMNYTDYLFSLPMGAGKTYLMAAFIYIDLYFASNEPHNPSFAHNFIIFAPSGLKSSVIPSLKTIQKFNPSWIIPEPAASNIKRRLVFEVLDQGKSASKSNKTKSPNVQKIANHQPLSELFGLVAVTNAEKVILDRIQEKNGQIYMFEESDDDKDRQANELRNLIGKLPKLSIFIDEVHHAVSEEIKLRAVVSRWAINKTVNSIIGFSGTPYLEKAEKISVINNLAVATEEITNVVYYYPLIDGVGNFLKKPVIKISNIADSAQIIDAGVRSFLATYKGLVYEGGLVAKLGIYCGTIEKLEELVFPLVSRIVAEYGITADVILKFHRGNKKHPQPADSQMNFDTLDSPISKIRIVLLVQIGKEGWDCRSLTGIILSQVGDCPQNMVLQTSCRCLRQVMKGVTETALIYLNASNADKLNLQLQQQQHISLKEFAEADKKKVTLNRYSRMAYLKLPKIEYYQLKINYETLVIDNENDTAYGIEHSADNAKTENIVLTTDFAMKTIQTEVIAEERGNTPATFISWLYGISKGGFCFITIAQLKTHETVLYKIYDMITYTRNGSVFYSSQYNLELIEANIRKAFYERRSFTTVEELIPNEASLLKIANLKTTVHTDNPSEYFPQQNTVENIMLDDKGKLKIDPRTAQMIALAEETGNTSIADTLRKQNGSHLRKDRSFHYLPYHTDSRFEQVFLQEVLTLKEIEDIGLEIYFNGDRAMTEFQIRCYKSSNEKWQYIGMYTPDFLILKRKNGTIHKAIIVETKGQIYANDLTFKDKRQFMETEFLKQNNSKFGYKRFNYLYFEDTMPEKERIIKTHRALCEFFKEE